MRLVEEVSREPYLTARVEVLPNVLPSEPDVEFRALTQSVREQAAAVVTASAFLSNDLPPAIERDEPAALADIVSWILPGLATAQRQDLLETTDVRRRLAKLNEELIKQLHSLRIQERIRRQVEEKIDKAQNQFFLREQLKAIRQELGESDDDAERLAKEARRPNRRGRHARDRESGSEARGRSPRSHSGRIGGALGRANVLGAPRVPPVVPHDREGSRRGGSEARARRG